MLVDHVHALVYRLGKPLSCKWERSSMQINRRPWYSVRYPAPNPPPAEAISRPWLIEKLANGRGCPDVARCGIQGRDGEGCGQRYHRPDPTGDRANTAYLREYPGALASTMQSGSGATYSGSSTTPSSGSGSTAKTVGSSASHAGTVGLRVPVGEEDEKCDLVGFTPEALRDYALWWRKLWNIPMNCAGYDKPPTVVQDFSCELPDGWSRYAQGYRRQRGQYDVTPADRSVRMDSRTALERYLAGVEVCMQAGNNWRECANKGGLIDLRNAALQQGVSENLLNVSLGFLGKPMEKDALRQGIFASCELQVPGARSVCSSIADTVTNAALAKAGWMLTASGQALQEAMKIATGDSVVVAGDGDPRRVTARAVPVLQASWKSSLAALQAAWDASRQQLGLRPASADFAGPLMKHLLANGWSTANSNAWQHGGARIWLVGIKGAPAPVDPGSADHTMWPWAASYQRWDRTRCDIQCRTKVRDGLFSLYSLLRIDPLQQALTQGLRDIAVMVASESMPNAR